MIKFGKLTGKNIGSIGASTVSFDLSQEELILIHGSNGSGKSTIIEIIFLALFGKPYRAININELINDFSERELEVSIEVYNGKTKYTISRGRVPDYFRISENDEDYNKFPIKNVTKMQQFINTKIVGMDRTLFAQLSVIGKSRDAAFLDFTTEERRQFNNKTFDLLYLPAMAKEVKAQRKVVKEKIDNAERNITAIINQIEKEEIRKESYNDLLTQQRKQHTDHLCEIELKQQGLSNDIVQLDKVITTLKDIILAYKIEDFRKRHKELLENKQALVISNKDINKKLKYFDDHAHCDRCDQEITDVFKDIQKHRLSATFHENTVGIEIFDTALTVSKETDDEFNFQNGKLIKARWESTNKAGEILSLDNERKRIGNLLDNLKADGSFDGTLIDKYKKDLKDIKVKLGKFHIQYECFEFFAKTVLNDKVGIKQFFLNQYIPELNRIINRLIKFFKLDLEIAISNEFEFKLLHKGNVRPYHRFSFGEKMRINMAIMFAYIEIIKYKRNINNNLLFFDETLDSSMDKEGIEQFIDILNEYKLKYNMSVFIISHSIQKGLFRNYIEVKNQNGISIYKGALWKDEECLTS